MAKVKELLNTSRSQVQVEVNGTTVFLPPRGKILNANVENLNAIRGQVKVTEDLSEITQAPGRGRRVNG